MFLEINGVYTNKRLIASIVCYEEDSKYYILYNIQNGEKLIEEFDTESSRNTKYEEATS